MDWIEFALSSQGDKDDSGSEQSFTFLAKLDLDAFLHSGRLVTELVKIRTRRRLWYGGDCFHVLEKRFGFLAPHDVLGGFAASEGGSASGGGASEGAPAPSRTFPSLQALGKRLKLCGEFYLLSRDLAEAAVSGQNWRSVPHRRGKFSEGAGVEDDVVADMIKWALDESEISEEELNIVSDWFRLPDHAGMDPTVGSSRRSHRMALRPDVSADWIQPLGRHAEVLVLHQLKTEKQWEEVMLWLDKTENGAGVCRG